MSLPWMNNGTRGNAFRNRHHFRAARISCIGFAICLADCSFDTLMVILMRDDGEIRGEKLIRALLLARTVFHEPWFNSPYWFFLFREQSKGIWKYSSSTKSEYKLHMEFNKTGFINIGFIEFFSNYDRKYEMYHWYSCHVFYELCQYNEKDMFV